MGNPRGGDKSVHMKARMWDRLMGDASAHGGLRALTFGDGTLIVYDPALTPQEADRTLPEFLTGHPAVTAYPLRSDHTVIPEPDDPQVYRHRAAIMVANLRDYAEGGYASGDVEWMAAATQEVRMGGKPCSWDSGCNEPAHLYHVQLGDDMMLSWLCEDHARSALAFARSVGTGGTVKKAD